MASLIRQIVTNFSRLSINKLNTSAGSRMKLPKLLPTTCYSTTPTPYEIVDLQQERKDYQGIINKVNEQVSKREEGRLFAVVHVAGKQFKITEGDVLIIEGYWAPDAGDRISLDKILLVGAADFTLIGRPLVQRDLVKVEATVVEKTLSHTKTHFKKKRRKNFKKIHFYRIPQTWLRINRIAITGELNNTPDVSQGPLRTF